MLVEVVTVGTELLIGEVVDTNAVWIAQELAAAGIDCHWRTTVGDNRVRIAQALRAGLARCDAVVVCGGLGPTQDDITREAIADVMNVPLERDPAIVEALRALFAARGRAMAASNERQADVPAGAHTIPQVMGTAPGLVCPVGKKVVYALPGVPAEMREMFARAVLPDLAARSGEAAVIAHRTLSTWGLAESALADLLATHIAELDELAVSAAATGGGECSQPVPTIAFQASGPAGIKVRIAVKASGEDAADAAAAVLDAQEKVLRGVLGDAVFGVDGERMEEVVAGLVVSQGLTVAVAESLTGGLVAARLVNVPGASEWFRGGIVAYATEAKRELLAIGDAPAVSEEAAIALARGACRMFDASVGIGVTGVAGPDPQDGEPPGVVWLAVALPAPGAGSGTDCRAVRVVLPGNRDTVRDLAAMSALDLLRRRLERG